MTVDLDLVRKYNVPAPRYTSYPPATQFTELAPDQVLERIRANNRTARELSLYFHLPFCRSLCWYCGCTTVTTTHQKASARYVDYLKKEVALMAAELHRGSRVVQVHFGGGTPTFLLPSEIRELGRLISGTFKVKRDAEMSVEIDPRRLTQEHVAALREAGFTRASVGIQDFDPEVQKAINRFQTKEQTERAIQWLRDAGFTSLNFDLIYGLPHQSAGSFEKTLEAVIALRPQRIAAFSYAHVPWVKPAQQLLPALPSPETKLTLLKLTVETLTAHGFCYIGMDHFARADDELAIAQREGTLQRNFQGYSTRGHADIHAFGMSAISQADGIYWQNFKMLPAYYSALDSGTPPISRGCILSEEDKIRREVIARLMCDLRLDFAEMSRRLGIVFADHFSRELASLADLQSDGLIAMNSRQLVVTDTGRLLIRIIAMRFDAYREADGASEKFSKSV
jgi:oxygen-independent coproporphyrinogen-3 oxidase